VLTAGAMDDAVTAPVVDKDGGGGACAIETKAEGPRSLVNVVVVETAKDGGGGGGGG